MRRGAWLIAGVGLMVAGCYEAHAGGPRRDGGARGDAGPVERRDAGPVVGRDAGPRPDAGPGCAGAEWIDEAPTLRPFDTARGPSVTAAPGAFHVAYWYVDFDVCDGPCPVALSLRAEGPQPERFEVSPMYWADWSDLRRVEAHTDPDGTLWFAAIGERRVAWARTPEPGWMAAGAFESERPVGDVAFTERGFVWVQTHAPGPDGLTQMRLHVHTPDGEPVDVIDGEMLTSGFEFEQPALADSPNEPWIGFTQDVDFPPTVQLARPFAGPEPWFGSSCGVESFDLASGGLERAWVIEDCGRQVLLEARDGLGGTERLELSEAHHPDAAPAIAPHRDGWVAAWWERDGAARVAWIDARRGVQLATVPGVALAPGQLPGALSVASAGDILAVAWSRTTPDAMSPSEGAIQRFRPCP